MIRDLATLIAPETPEFFYNHFLQKARFHIKSPDPDRAVFLLPWSEINRLVEADTLPRDRLQLVRTANFIAPRMYRTAGDDGRLRACALQDLLRQGASMVINRIDGLVPSIGRLAAAIERKLSSEVGVNAYLSFGIGSAFKAHYDLHDVVVLQVHGRKRWQSYGVPFMHPIEEFVSKRWTAGDVVWEGILEPGDVLYLPRGEIHEGALEAANSVHLTIGIRSRRGVDFAEAIFKQAGEDIIFRQDIPVAEGQTALAQHETALKKALHALIERTELSRYLDGDGSLRRLTSVVNLGISPPFHANTIIEPAVRRRIRLNLESEGEAEVAVGGEKFRLSLPARHVLDFLIRHDASVFGAVVSALERQLAEPAVQGAVAELAEKSLVALRT